MRLTFPRTPRDEREREREKRGEGRGRKRARQGRKEEATGGIAGTREVRAGPGAF